MNLLAIITNVYISYRMERVNTLRIKSRAKNDRDRE
jgi:hypothetical protein